MSGVNVYDTPWWISRWFYLFSFFFLITHEINRRSRKCCLNGITVAENNWIWLFSLLWAVILALSDIQTCKNITMQNNNLLHRLTHLVLNQITLPVCELFVSGGKNELRLGSCTVINWVNFLLLLFLFFLFFYFFVFTVAMLVKNKCRWRVFLPKQSGKVRGGKWQMMAAWLTGFLYAAISSDWQFIDCLFYWRMRMKDPFDLCYHPCAPLKSIFFFNTTTCN